MKSVSIKLILIVFSLVFVSVIHSQNKEKPVEGNDGLLSAVCVLHPTEGNKVKGIVTFKQTLEGVSIVADVEGLTIGKHGFHIHEFGDCSELDGKSAGGHFNPEGKNHGAPDALERHVGDLGNLSADETGKAHYESVNNYLSLSGPNSIIGRAIIVHEGEDDLTSQPTGNAGGRVACGVIGISK